ncbi:hypothetical protein D3C87_1147910 [compost metagenome]
MRRIAAECGDENVSLHQPSGGFHRLDASCFNDGAHDAGIVEEGNAGFFGHAGKFGGKHEAIAGLVARQAQAAHDLLLRRREAGFDGGAAVAVENLERHAARRQHVDILADGVELLLGAEYFERALHALVIFDAGLFTQGHQAIAAIFGDAHHAALVDRITRRGAVAQHLAHPAPGGRVGRRADDQRRVFHEQPFHRLHRNAGGSPGRGIAGGNLSRIGEAGFQRRGRLAVDHRHLVSGFGQIPGGCHADDAGSEDSDVHDRLTCD